MMALTLFEMTMELDLTTVLENEQYPKEIYQNDPINTCPGGS